MVNFLENKRCGRCGLLKFADEFSFNAATKDFLDYHCRSCRSEYYYLNRDEISIKGKKLRADRAKLKPWLNAKPKYCNTCGELKEPDEFHRNSQSADGLRVECKKCGNQKANKRIRAKRQKQKEQELVLMQVKQCISCQEIKDHSEFYKQPFSRDKLQSQCKECMKQYTRERQPYSAEMYQRHKALNKSEGITEKTCKTCERTLPVDMFHKQPMTKDGLAYHCIDCMREYHRAKAGVKNPQKPRGPKAGSYIKTPRAATRTITSPDKELECIACHEIFHHSKFYIYTTRKGTKVAHSRCKPCHNKHTSELRRKPPKINQSTEKICTKCGDLKDYTEFYLALPSSNSSRRRGECIECYGITANRKNQKQEVLTEKECSACGETQPINKFYAYEYGRGGVGEFCIPCHNSISQDIGQSTSTLTPPEVPVEETAEELLDKHFPVTEAELEEAEPEKDPVGLMHSFWVDITAMSTIEAPARKKCAKCKELKTDDNFNIRGGWTTWCRSCMSPGSTEPIEEPAEIEPEPEVEEPAVPSKKCSDCLQVKPLTEFRVFERSPDGRGPQCLACISYKEKKYGSTAPAKPAPDWAVYGKARHIANKQEAWAFARNMGVTEKQCRGCGVVKPVEEYWAARQNKDGLQNTCSACSTARFESNKDNKITAEQCLEIHVLREEGLSLPVVANKMDLSYGVVQYHAAGNCSHGW